MRRVASAAITALVGLTSLSNAASPAAAASTDCSVEGISLSALHGPNFYIDTAITPNLLGAYAGYRLVNNGAPRTDLWVKLTNFSGGSVALGSGQSAAEQISSLAGGGAGKSLFWYLSATGASATAQNHDVEVWTGRPDLPSSTQLCGTTGGFSAVAETIKAAANKLTSVTVPTAAPGLGSTFSIEVKGDTGTIGSGTATDPGSFWMSPAALATWPADAYRLVGTQLDLGGTIYTDLLRVANVSGASQSYTATYTFRAVGPTASATSVVPVQQIASGTQIKHTDIGSIASLPQIPATTSDLSLAKTAAPTSLPSGGGEVHYEVAVSGSAGAEIDSFSDQVPAGATLVPGSVTWRGGTVPDGVMVDGTLTFTGPFTVAESNNVLGYDLTLAATSGDATNTIVAQIGSASVDASTSLTDDTPAAATVHVNESPTATDDTPSVSQDLTAQLAVLANDTDPEGDPLTITAVTQPANGTVAINGSRITYTPPSGFTGTETFTYTIEDGKGGSSTATVTVTVTAPEPLAPVDDAVQVDSGAAVTFDPTVNDAGSPPFQVTGVSSPSHGTASVDSNGQVVYTANSNYVGQDTFTYTVSDGLGGSATATVNVTVVAPLVAGDDTAKSIDGAPITIAVLGNDTGQGALTVTSTDDPNAVIESDGSISYNPPEGQYGTFTFTYTVIDDAGHTKTATVTVRVVHALAATNDTVQTDRDQALTFDPRDNDQGEDPLTVVSVGQPAHGTAIIDSNGLVRYTPATGYVGPDSFTYDLSDAGEGQVTATVTVTVNTPLVLGDDSVVSGGTAVTIPVLDNDTGEGTLTITRVIDPSGGTLVDNGDGTLTYTPPAGQSGEFTFTYQVTDSAGHVQSAVVTVTVPAAMSAVNDTAGTDDATPVTIDLTGNDGGYGDLTVTTIGEPSAGSVRNNGDGTITYTPTSGGTGPIAFTYTITDSLGRTATATITVSVAPQTKNDTVKVAGDGPSTIDVLGNDSPGLTLVSVTDPGHGATARIVGGKIVLTPPAGFSGTLTMTYTVRDANGVTSTATLTVTFAGNKNPTVSAAPVSVTAGSAVRSYAKVSDPNTSDVLSLRTGTAQRLGRPVPDLIVQVSGNRATPTLTVRAPMSLSGVFGVPLKVTDGRGGVGTNTLKVTVSPRPAGAKWAGLVADPAAGKALSRPKYSRGVPVSQTLATRLDSRVIWTASPTSSVTSYEVRVNGKVACRVASRIAPSTPRTLGPRFRLTRVGLTQFSCLLTDRVLKPSDVVTVTALGLDGTRSKDSRIPVAAPASANRLVAVVYFPTGSFKLDKAAQRTLKNVDGLAVRYGMSSVQMTGHTDSRGSISSNDRLSKQRAKQVGNWFTSHGHRVSFVSNGYGELRPAVTNRTVSGRAANRRVEIYAN